jgi:hypothetical protein
MKYILLFLKWYFTMVERNGFVSDVTGDRMLLRHGTGIPFEPEAAQHLTLVVSAEAQRLGLPISIENSSSGLIIGIGANEDKTDSSVQQSV